MTTAKDRVERPPSAAGRLLAAALGAAVAAPAFAQAPAPPEGTGCGPRAALFAGEKGFKVLVVRSGTLMKGDPLRPLDAVTLQVLEARIGAKVATAYGADFDALRRGLAPADLQAANGGGAIAWADTIDAVPRALRIVEEDGTPIAVLAFESCADRPKAASERVARPAPKARSRPKDAGSASPGLALPQGAIP